jgi:Domain of unknown function (DUF4397)
MRTNTAVSLSAVGVSLILMTTGCSRESKQNAPVTSQSEAGASTAPASGEAAKEQGQALVRVVNAVPRSQPLEVLAENNPVVTRVIYKDMTPYKEVPASADEFAIKPSTQEGGEPIATNSESIMGGRHYTLVIYPEPNDRNERNDADTKKVSLEVISDDLQQPSAGKARVRVINAAPGTDDVAVYLRGQKDALFSDVDFKEAVSYKEVDPVKSTLELKIAEGMLSDTNPKTGEPAATREAPVPRTGTDADRAQARADHPRPGEVLGTHTIDLEAGKSYTIVLAGTKDRGQRHLDTLIVEDTVPTTPAATN